MVFEQLFLYIILIHFLADFGLQTHDQTINKSQSNKWLFYHVGVYSLIWILASFIIFLNIYLTLAFALITFIIHFITDWITSRISKSFFEKKDYHNGFVVVGFDQVLHYIQLYYTFKFFL